MRKLVATLSPCTAIPKISQYHSFEFHHDHMIMWRYFDIEEGKRWNYTNISFTPNITVVLPFSSTTFSISEGAAMSKKRRDDRTLCDLYFCTVPRFIVSSPLKLGGGVLVFKIWTKRRVMKKLFSNRGLVERGGPLRKRGVSKLFHPFSFRKAFFHCYWIFFVW